MSNRRQPLVNNEIYHIIVRGVADLPIFRDTDDYYRAIFSIYEFNTTKPVEITKRRNEIKIAKEKFKAQAQRWGDPLSSEIGGERVSFNSINHPDKRDPLVEILLFCFMPNHIHLLLRQIKDGGITKFMNKFGAGYPAYFKKKHRLEGKGYFFQGRFVSVRIKTEEQLRVVFVYIHANPISLVAPKWKEKGVNDFKKVIKFLENYKWSSYLDYIGKKNFSSLTQKDFFLKILGGEQGCKESVENWIRHKGETKKFA